MQNHKTTCRIAVAWVVLLVLGVTSHVIAQMGTPTPLSPAERSKAAAERQAAGALTGYPQLVDITASTGIRFEHKSSPEAKFIAESMSGGVALIDYDRDGWPDIYFTNAPSVEMALHGVKARSALFRNNHDGTFSDVTDKAGVGYPCFAMGVAVGDYNNDGWPDLLVTCSKRRGALSQQWRRNLYGREQGQWPWERLRMGDGCGLWRLRPRRLARSFCLALRGFPPG